MQVFQDELIGAATVWAEGRSEPRTGQVAIAEVIRNRTRARYASKGTVASTVLWPKQFSCWNESTVWRHKILELDLDSPEVVEAVTAWRIAWDKNVESNVANGANLYHTINPPPEAKKWPPYWATKPGVKLVATIGDHKFYTDGNGK